MRRTAHAIIGSVLLVAVTGCVDRTHTATLIGKVGGDENRTESIRFPSSDDVAFAGVPPLPNADIAIVVSQPDGDQILASTKSAADGSFTLDYPRELPVGAALLVTAPGHAPYRNVLNRPPPGYNMLGIVLKKLQRVVSDPVWSRLAPWSSRGRCSTPHKVGRILTRSVRFPAARRLPADRVLSSGMLQPFFAVAMRAPGRHLTFRRVVAFHVLLLTCLGWTAAKAENAVTLSAVGQLALILGIVEGAALVGWRLAQLPKSQALEFLLVSPLQPRRVFLAETLVGIGRFALVCLSGLPILLAMVLFGAIGPADLWPLALMPFAWGIVAALGLTVWAYESAGVRRVGEIIGMFGVLVYLVVGILAGENLRLWLTQLPSGVAEWVYSAVMEMHNGNPFGVMRNWFTLRDGPTWVWPRFVEVNVLAAILGGLFGLRAAFRLKGHFHDRHYKPIDSNRENQSEFIGDRPLSWWAVRRVMEYSGRVNVWLAGGFCLLYAAFLVAGDQWPAWMGRLPFLLFESWGGAPMVATAMCVLAAVPAVFQYGLWDSTVTNRCQRLELLLLTDLSGRDYWHASISAAWRRGRSYLAIAAVLWIALVWSGRVAWYEAVAAALGGCALWAFSFAVGFRAFSTGRQAGGVAMGFTLGLPLLLFALVRAKLETLAAFVPTGLCYLPVKSGVSAAWIAGLVLLVTATWWLTRQGLARCEIELRRWLDANQGRKAE